MFFGKRPPVHDVIISPCHERSGVRHSGHSTDAAFLARLYGTVESTNICHLQRMNTIGNRAKPDPCTYILAAYTNNGELLRIANSSNGD